MPQASPSPLPLTIAHRAGNRLSALAEALAAGVDYVETDVWLYRRRLEVRHDKRAGPLPILWDRWTLRPGWRPRLLLDEVLAAASGRGKLFIDLKGEAVDTAEAVADAVTRAGAQEAVAFTTPIWDHLDKLATLLPEAPRFYTIGKPERLPALRPRLSRGEIAAISINSDFLTEDMVTELSAAGVGTIAAWHVETAERAERVLGWGVTGINSDSVALLISILEGRVGANMD